MNPLDTSIWIFNFPSLFVHLHIHMNDNIECKLKINIGDLLRHKCRLQKSKIKIKLIAQWFYPLHIYIVILIFSKSHSSFVSLQCITIFVLFIRINFLTTWLNFLFKIFLCYILHWGGGKKKKRNSSQLYTKKKKTIGEASSSRKILLRIFSDTDHNFPPSVIHQTLFPCHGTRTVRFVSVPSSVFFRRGSISIVRSPASRSYRRSYREK